MPVQYPGHCFFIDLFGVLYQYRVWVTVYSGADLPWFCLSLSFHVHHFDCKGEGKPLVFDWLSFWLSLPSVSGWLLVSLAPSLLLCQGFLYGQLPYCRLVGDKNGALSHACGNYNKHMSCPFTPGFGRCLLVAGPCPFCLLFLSCSRVWMLVWIDGVTLTTIPLLVGPGILMLLQLTQPFWD